MMEKGKKISQPVKLWGELAVTINMGDFENLKVRFGHERLAPNGKEETLKKYEKAITQFNEEVMERHIQRALKIIRRAKH
jgi:1-acyl-sn-glycerol-3-phosphate acyltransferase